MHAGQTSSSPAKDAGDPSFSPPENGFNSRRWGSGSPSVPGPKPPLASVSLERTKSPPAWDQVIMFGEGDTERKSAELGDRRAVSYGSSRPAAMGSGGFAGTIG